jgi:hypothetical protein
VTPIIRQKYCQGYRKIFCRIVRTIVFHLPKDREHEVHVRFRTYSKYISMGYDTREELLCDNEVISTRCCYCHRNIKRKMKWFTPNGRHYYCVSYCAEHGYMKSKLRIRKAENGMLYGVKTDRFISADELAMLRKMESKIAQTSEINVMGTAAVTAFADMTRPVYIAVGKIVAFDSVTDKYYKAIDQHQSCDCDEDGLHIYEDRFFHIQGLRTGCFFGKQRRKRLFRKCLQQLPR